MQNCMKCFENVSDISLRKCNHSICNKCLCSYLENISSAKMSCPIETCSKTIDDSVIRKCLSDLKLNFYDVLCCAPNTVKCIIKDCPYFISFDEPGGHFTCPVCKQPNCLTCQRIHDIDDHCTSIRDYDVTVFEARARDALKERERLVLEQLFKEYCLLPNPSSFTCPICDDFILPRKGIKLRNCLHEFCEACFKESMKSPEFISHMTCLIPTCSSPLDSSEISVLINEEKLATMMRTEAAARFFQCKNEDCIGMCELTNATTSYTCDICHQDNCVVCEYIHVGMNCDEFRKTKSYIGYKILGDNLRIKCFLCYNELIKEGGCGAMCCNRCGNHTCIFTGKIAGSHDPQKCYCGGAKDCSKKDYYCNCTASRPCHKDCKYGCIPDR